MGLSLYASPQTSTEQNETPESAQEIKKIGIFFNGLPIPPFSNYGITAEYKLKSDIVAVVGAQIRKTSQINNLTENNQNQDIFVGAKYFLGYFRLSYATEDRLFIPFIAGGYQIGQAQSTVSQTMGFSPLPPSAQKRLRYQGAYASIGSRGQGSEVQPGFTIDVAASYVPGQIFNTNYSQSVMENGALTSDLDMSLRYQILYSI